jgi:hypothetical protein
MTLFIAKLEMRAMHTPRAMAVTVRYSTLTCALAFIQVSPECEVRTGDLCMEPMDIDCASCMEIDPALGSQALQCVFLLISFAHGAHSDVIFQTRALAFLAASVRDETTVRFCVLASA